jgi:hypothetical protein
MESRVEQKNAWGIFLEDERCGDKKIFSNINNDTNDDDDDNNSNNNNKILIIIYNS